MRAFLIPIGYPPDRAVPIFAEKEAAIPCDGDPNRSFPNITFGRDEPGNEIFVLAARSRVAVVEARRRYALAHDDQFGAVAIVVTAIYLSLHRFSQPDAKNGMKFEQTRATTGH